MKHNRFYSENTNCWNDLLYTVRKLALAKQCTLTQSAEQSVVDGQNLSEESSKYSAGVLQAISDKMSPSLSNQRKKHLKPNAVPLMLLS